MFVWSEWEHTVNGIEVMFFCEFCGIFKGLYIIDI